MGHYNRGMARLNFLSIHQARQAIQDRSISPIELRQECARQVERLNPALNAFITICPETETVERVGPSALMGIPIAVKDLYETKGIRTTAGSRFFSDYIPQQNAYSVQKLLNAGAVLTGKTNTHEIALGVTTNNPHFGPCRNPWDPARIPGGSSGGSAVAVATGMSLAAVGLKPTYGRVSVRGVIPLSWNLDHAGPLARTVQDAALLLQLLAGYDPEDPFSTAPPPHDSLTDTKQAVKGWRIAVASGDYFDEVDEEVSTAIQAAATVFEDLGANVERVEMSYLREAALANSLMTQSDGAAFHRERLAEHPEWFGADVRQRLETGRNFTSSEYALARKTQAEMKRRLEDFFQKFRILLLPSTPITAPLIEGSDAIEQARRLTRFTSPFNLTGLPAISVPCGFSHAGLPLGMQLVARAWDEAALISAAYAYEQENSGGTRTPDL